MSEQTAGNVWESDVVKNVENEFSGGGGWICRTLMQFGYKVFAKGFDNDQTFFPFELGNQSDQDRARAEAKKFKTEYDATVQAGEKEANLTMAVRIQVDKDSVYGKDTSTWHGDRIWDVPTWTRAYKEVIRPEAKKANANIGWQWARVTFKPDPYKPTRINQMTGEEVDNLVAYVAEVFDSKQDALDAAASVGTPEEESTGQASIDNDSEPQSSSDIPEGYDKESWELCRDDIISAKEAGTPLKEIAEMYGVEIKDIVKVK